MSITQDADAGRTVAHRAFYARFILARAGVTNARLSNAFAATPRETFVGPGPWLIQARGRTYVPTPNADPCFLYQDVLVGIDASRGLNNGEPSLHALCLDALAPAEGEHVLHIGIGTGYYTAILARMVGPSGHVDGYELDAPLAERAATNLRSFGRVRIHSGNVLEHALPPADAIYVSAGATHPDRTWLDALKPEGRLLFPLTGSNNFGGMLLVQRKPAGFAARFISAAGFIPCEGVRDPETANRLVAVFAAGGKESVRALHLDISPDSSCWFAGNRWWLSTDELAE
jgi:protein-L-isoaspartate(D-aspartate) O-methyltransferase